MCQMFRTQVKKSTDLHNEMRQQLKDIEAQTEITIESHSKLQLRVGDIEQRQEQTDSRVGDIEHRQEQTDSRVRDIDQRLSCTQEEVDSISKEQTKLKEAVDAVKDENKAHHPSEEGKLF